MKTALATLLLAAACYEPQARDCTLECEAADECAEGQVCGPDGFCAAADVAGNCNAANGDETSMVTLIVTIEGKGKVVVDRVGTCDSDSPEGMCTFDVLPGVMRQLAAIQLKDDREFISWTSTCSGTTTTCSLTPVTLTHVGAKFE